MQSREFSIAVLGASGFTGKRVVQQLLKSNADVTIGPYAVAGRSAGKLQKVLAELGAESRFKVIGGIDVTAEAGAGGESALLKMVKRCKLVINGVGPFRLYGEAVVAACAQCGTHYLDICGEPEFIERMEYKYSDIARANGCFIASAAGYDSVPADFGTVLVQRAFKAPAVPSSVEAYLMLKMGPPGYKINYATWHSAVLGIGSVDNLRKLRQEVKKAGKAPNPQPVGPRPRNVQAAEYCSEPAISAWTLPFPGADASVVRRTQGYLQAAGEAAVHFTARFVVASRFYSWVAVGVGLAMKTLAGTGVGRSLLLSYPGLYSYGLVSKQGPTQEQIDSCKSVTVLVGHGYSQGPPADPNAKPDKKMVLRVTGPDPGYNATSILVVQAALTVLLEPAKLSGAPGGVYTPGALLRDTTYQQRLEAAGIKFEWLEQ